MAEPEHRKRAHFSIFRSVDQQAAALTHAPDHDPAAAPDPTSPTTPLDSEPGGD